jgi:hypothetical protein
VLRLPDLGAGNVLIASLVKLILVAMFASDNILGLHWGYGIDEI